MPWKAQRATGIRAGLTLIEVVVASLLLATIVVSVLSVQAGVTTRLHRDLIALEGSRHARELLAQWTLDPNEHLANAGGAIAGTRWQWTRSVTDMPHLRLKRAKRIDLTLKHVPDGQGGPSQAVTCTWIATPETK